VGDRKMAGEVARKIAIAGEENRTSWSGEWVWGDFCEPY